MLIPARGGEFGLPLEGYLPNWGSLVSSLSPQMGLTRTLHWGTARGASPLPRKVRTEHRNGESVYTIIKAEGGGPIPEPGAGCREVGNQKARIFAGQPVAVGKSNTRLKAASNSASWNRTH